MKKLIFLATMLIGCSAMAQESYFGERIDQADAISMQQLLENLESTESLDAKVEASVLEACQMKGCWMEVDAGDGKTMRVKFKDYGFFVPKNSAGKTAVMRGTATRETTSVADLRHYAEDGGKSGEEIEKITEPEEQLVFVADGVILKD